MFDCKNHFVIDIVYVIVQIILVFSFLVLFYFLYVAKVEHDEFQKQIDMLVDSFADDLKTSNFITLPDTNKISKDDLTVLLDGIIDTAQEKISRDSKSAIDSINASNAKLQKKSYIIVAILAVVLAILSFSSFCVPIFGILKEALIIVFFVGLTEFIFLRIISARYISADPNNVKLAIGQAVNKWLKDNGKV